ncbi:piggyBac transposable element-derived protein 4-like isoform X2 [Montipora capricornis]|uniref:piggyBac transposable element-derived protein 4-like isoform X2 n=1 Tax=Montipora capricornis TaxID=246305 RepID=UPI0035F11F78
MASSRKRARANLISAEVALGTIFNSETSAEGMDNGEESDFDQQLENDCEKLSGEDEYGEDEYGEDEVSEEADTSSDEEYEYGEDKYGEDEVSEEADTSSDEEDEYGEDEYGEDEVSEEAYTSSDNPVASGAHVPGHIHSTAASPNVSPPQSHGVSSSCRGDRSRTDPKVVPFKSYDDLDVGNPISPFTPLRPVGVHFGHLLEGTMTKAVEFFHLFFTMDMINNIASHTNSYALEHIFSGSDQSCKKPDDIWQKTTADEIKRLIALLVYMGLVKVHGDVDKYWSTKSLYNGLWAKGILSRKRFKGLMALLHIIDPATENKADKLCEVQSFIRNFKSQCLSLYQPRQQLAVDERMIQSILRSDIHRFIMNKPNKFGIKVWVLLDRSNGYTLDFDVYLGKTAGQTASEKGLGYDVVWKLARQFFDQGYHLFVDKFYTSFALFKDLFAQGVFATGTVRKTRQDFPASLKKSKEWSKGRERGSMRWERDPPCLALQWIDNKVVSVLTTIDNANEYSQVNRKTKNAGVWGTKVIQQPKVISSCNKYVNIVDHSDQILATHNVLNKCMRWWKTLFFHLIDIAVLNAFILFKENQKKSPNEEALRRPACYSLGDFREEIVRQLCGFPEYDVPPASASVESALPPPPPPLGEFETVHIPVFTEVKKRCVVCYQREKKDSEVYSFCNAPQCKGKYMHVTSKDCFKIFHSKEYHS